MTEVLNLLFAWLTVVAMVLLTAIYPMRVCSKKYKPHPTHPIVRIHSMLRRVHKPLGVFIIGLTFLHCRFSSQRLGANTGTACLVLLVLLLATWMLRKVLGAKWLRWHRALTAALWLLILLHIVLVKIFL